MPYKFLLPFSVNHFGDWNQSAKPIYFINAYAVSVNGGSEPSVGFSWLNELLSHFRVVLFTESEFKADLINFLKNRKNISCKIYFLNIGKKARSRCWNQGNWRFYLDYWIYQLNVLYRANFHIKYEKPLFLHQLNMIGFREPGYFWVLSARYKIPFIWGPVGGFNFPSPLIYSFYGLKNILLQFTKNILNIISFLLPSVFLSYFVSRVCLLAMPPKGMILNFFLRKSVVFPETFCKQSILSKKKLTLFSRASNATKDSNDVNFKSKINIVILGKLIPRKLVDLAIEAFHRIPKNELSHIRLHIVGDGPSYDLLFRLVEKYSLGNSVIFYGSISHLSAMSILAKSEILLHCSIDEGTSHSVVEALTLGKKVIMFDSGGHSIIARSLGAELMPYPNARSLAIISIKKNIQKFIRATKLEHKNVYSKNKLNYWAPKNRILKFLNIINRITYEDNCH
jgi:glycosyltransferase involved in cell wall biosynthesis